MVGCEQDKSRGVVFEGLCDGSAAVRIGREQILIASDEINSLFLYDGAGGPLKQTYALSNLLPLSGDDEFDLEAAARFDDGIWWIGSHGLDASADDAPNRRVLFRTNVPGADNLKLQSDVYDLSELLKGVVDSDALSLAPKKGGINIEGLALTTDGDFMIALRSPLSDGLKGDALIVQASLTGDGFNWIKTHRLALGNKGIRDLVITNNGYLLIAGSIDSGGDFSVYRWNLSGQLTELFKVPSGFNAEALVDMGQHWLLLSDDGKVERSDSEGNYSDCEDIDSADRSVFHRGLKFAP